MLIDVLEELAATLQAAADADPEPYVADMQIGALRNFNPTPPTIDIYPGDPSRDTFDTAAFNEIGGELDITVRARVSTADNQAGQQLLLRFMDDDDDMSIAGTLMEDQTLNGLASSVYVDGFTGFELHDGAADGGPLLGVRWHVRLLREIT
jgi:hypothetical protein